MTISIIQSNYIPWKGYFDIIASCDVFVVYDSVQFNKNNWRNRNRIKGINGPMWLTIPIAEQHGLPSIDSMHITNDRWKIKHIKSIENSYVKARYFDEYFPKIKMIYDSCDSDSLTIINQHFIKNIMEILKIDTKIVVDKEIMPLGNSTNETVANFCKYFRADNYISGPIAKSYLSEEYLANVGTKIEWMDYIYEEYEQVHPPFVHEVSIVDLILNTGPKAKELMRRIK